MARLGGSCEGGRREKTSRHLFRTPSVVLLRKTVISRKQRQTMALNMDVSVANKYAVVLLLFQQIHMHLLCCVYSNRFFKKQENY